MTINKVLATQNSVFCAHQFFQKNGMNPLILLRLISTPFRILSLFSTVFRPLVNQISFMVVDGEFCERRWAGTPGCIGGSETRRVTSRTQRSRTGMYKAKRDSHGRIAFFYSWQVRGSCSICSDLAVLRILIYPKTSQSRSSCKLSITNPVFLVKTARVEIPWISIDFPSM